MGLALGHEKLRVYQRGLDYASWTHAMLAGIIEQSAAALECAACLDICVSIFVPILVGLIFVPTLVPLFVD